MLVRRLARPMLSSIFVTSGFNAIRNPDPKAPIAAPFLDKMRSVLPAQAAALIPADAATAVRVNGGVQIVGGLLLATGRVPRVASLALAGSLVPTTLAGHPFWQEDDKAAKANQKAHFVKNLSILGGLLIAAGDTAGRPSLGWRARKAAGSASQRVSNVAAITSARAHDAAESVRELRS